MARGDAPRTPWLSSGLVLEPPYRAPSALCGRFAAPGQTSRLLEQVLGTKRVCRPCRFRVSERGLVYGRCAWQGWPFALFAEADRLTAAEQPFQGLDPGVSIPVPKLSKR